MLHSLSVATPFAAVPHLPTSQLMLRHGGKLRFSLAKPNVVVGPNGSGKSALLHTLALRFLASQTGQSSLDGRYLSDRDNEQLWSKPAGWGDAWEFMAGLTVATDDAPARYYRPGHIPGNEDSVTHAMMCGYMCEAKAYARLTEQKSSGQKSTALLDNVRPVLDGSALPTQYTLHNWSGGRTPSKVDEPWRHRSPWESQADVLRGVFGGVRGGVPVVLMDEPEQSLDALAELRLWKAIEAADCSKVQVIVATHSLYPLQHTRRFNVIEAADGYAAEVQALLGQWPAASRV